MSLIARTSRQSRQTLGRILDRHLSEITRRIYVGETSGSAPQVQVDLAGERTGNDGQGQRVISIFDLTGPRNSYKSTALRDHHVRWQSGSSAALPTDDSSRKTKPEENKDDPAGDSNNGQLVHSQYWGIAPKSFTREDGSPWLWNCFRPWEAYRTDTTIDVDKHYIPTGFVDKFADILVEKVLSPMSDAFFRERWGCHAVMLETVAAIPGMIGGMLLHLRSLRRFEHSGGWIKALLEEAENERMHLMTFMEVSKPVWHERLLVMAVQGVFFNGYFILYLVSPQLAHRFAGYLEEVAVQSYTRYLAAIDKGEVENIPAPAIAIDYWRLPKDARLRDVVIVVRADEAHHRDVQHFAADIRKQGKQLSEAPAPVGYQ